MEVEDVLLEDVLVVDVPVLDAAVVDLLLEVEKVLLVGVLAVVGVLLVAC